MYNDYMWAKKGFTLVELLIVIVVIAILAAITVVAYGNIQARADNTARLSEITEWQKAFEEYRALNGSLPNVPSSVTGVGYCLGSGFPNGYCRNYLYAGSYRYAQADNASLMSAFSFLSNIPSGPRSPINKTAGPWVIYFPQSIVLFQVFHDVNSGKCPAGTSDPYTDGSGLLICDINMED